MKKRYRFDKVDELLRKEYGRKIQRIEDNLSDDGSFDPDRVDGEMLLCRIKEQIWEWEKEKEEIWQAEKARRYLLAKAAGFFLVACVAVFCASMTSEANRTYLNDRIQYLMGNEVVMRIGGDKRKETVENDEKKLLVYQEIQEQIGIPVPVFGYTSDTENSFKYETEHEKGIATITYQYGDITLKLQMVNKEGAGLSGMAFHGKKIKEVDVMGGLFTIQVQKVKNTRDIVPNLTAQWEYGEGCYQLCGKLEEDKFIEILESIRY